MTASWRMARGRNDLATSARLTLFAMRGNAATMSDQPPSQKTWGGRFSEAASDLMREINASIPFDKRLWREDIAASKAHVAMLGEQGIVAEADAAAILEGLDQIAAEFERDGVPEDFEPRRHPHDDREPPRRADRAGRRAAAHRAHPQRPGGDRLPPVGARRDATRPMRASTGFSGRWSSAPRSMPTRSCPASPTCRSRSR